jgi:mono/diheme cytochrome c family protein
MTRIALFLLLAAQPVLSQQPFAGHCATCHGEDARGTAQGPGLAMNPRVAAQSVEQLRTYLQRGNPGAGMPSFADLPAAELASLAQYLRRINADTILMPVTAAPARKITWALPSPATGPPITATIPPIATVR